jgi:type III secretory pathway lipoprotein EscJ
MKTIWSVILIFLLSFCTSCSEQALLNNLSAKDSIEVLVILNQYGIPAKRVAIAQGRVEKYQVIVEEVYSPRALEILHSYGLPREAEESIESFTEPKGFVPNTTELTALRLDYALGMQLERTLVALKNVVDVKTIVRSNFKFRKGSDRAEPPSASVLIRYTSNSDKLPFSLNTVRQIVSQTVPGLPAEDVRITVSKVNIGTSENNSGMTTFGPFGFRIAEQDRSIVRTQILLAMMSCLVLGIIVGVLLYSLYSMRKNSHKRAVRKETTVLKNSFLLEGAIRSPSKGERSRK